jgi:hypothetical protein
VARAESIVHRGGRGVLPSAPPCNGSAMVRGSATSRQPPPGDLETLAGTHCWASLRTVRIGRYPHGIQEVEGSTPFGSTRSFRWVGGVREGGEHDHVADP